MHGTCALTAVTAQNTVEVRGVVALEPAFVRLQVEAVLDDFEVRSVKTGMLANAAIVGEVAAMAAAGTRSPGWWSIRSSSPPAGTALMEPDGVAAYLELLLPHALVVTPNLREAAVLGDTDVESLRTVEARVAVAERIKATGARYVVVKGGHLTESADDVVVGPRRRAGPPRGAGGHRQRPRHGLLALGRHRGPPGPGGRGARRDQGGQGLRRPRRWPGAPGGASAPATGPSTISGGPDRRRLAAA